jgi:hypothetical protein
MVDGEESLTRQTGSGLFTARTIFFFPNILLRELELGTS